MMNETLKRDDDIIISNGPNKTVSAVIKCSTGARVQKYLSHLLSSKYYCIMNLNVGMCTAIKNGLLMSQPSPNEASNFSSYFTPPVDMDECLTAEMQIRLEKQSKNGKLSADDMALVTTQKVQFPKTWNNLRHFVKKIAYLCNVQSTKRSNISN